MRTILKPFAWTSRKLMNKGLKYGLFAFASSMLLYEGSRAGNWLVSHFAGGKHLRSLKRNLRHISHPRKAVRSSRISIKRKVG